MATRLYPNASTAAPVSVTEDAAWDTSPTPRLLSTAGDTIAAGTLRSWTSGQLMCDRQFVSPMMKGGISFSGATVSGVMRCRQSSDVNDNVHSRICIRVVSRDGGTVRATLLAIGEYGTGTEFVAAASGAPSKIVADAEPLSSYTTQDGDRLVFENGATDNAGTTPQAVWVYGGSAGSDAFFIDGNTNNFNPWIEFSNDIEFLDGSGVADVAERGPDTVFFGYSATGGSGLATDLSGNDTDWTFSTSWIYLASHNEEQLQGRFSIEMAFLADSNDSGYLFENNADSAQNNAIYADGAGDVDIYVAGALMASLDVPSVSATSQLCLLQWSAEANPLTTGSGDALRHDVRLYNADTGEWTGASFTSAALTGFDSSADTVFGAQESGGTGAYSNTIRMVRLSSHHHTPDELVACFIEIPTAPTLQGVERLEFPVPDAASTLGDDGNFAGPQYLLAARHLRTAQMLLVGPLVNEICTGSWAEDSDWTMADPNSGSYDMQLEFLRRRPIPPTVNRVIFRVFVQQNDATADRLNIRAYSANAPGPIARPSQSPVDYVVHSAFVQRIADDGTGDTGGAWVTIGPLRIAQDDSGFSYFWISFASSCPDYRVKAWAVEPYFDDDPDVLGGGDIGGITGG